MGFVNHQIKRLKNYFDNVIEKPLLTTSFVLLFVTVVVVGLSLKFWINDFDNFYFQILAEASGMIFDIAVIGLLLFCLNQNGDTLQRIRTYKDEIVDLLLCESEEAAFRPVGNIK